MYASEKFSTPHVTLFSHSEEFNVFQKKVFSKNEMYIELILVSTC